MEDYRWKEFEMRVEAHRYYLNIALQTNVFFYAIAGVVLGFYLNRTTNEYLVFALLLPILIAGVLGSIFIYAAKLQREAAKIIVDMMEELSREPSEDKKLNIKEIPDLGLLYILLHIFGLIFFLIGVALIVTPFLKAAPFPICQPPTHLVLFAFAGASVLIVAGYWTSSFARKHDEKIKDERNAKYPKEQGVK